MRARPASCQTNHSVTWRFTGLYALEFCIDPNESPRAMANTPQSKKRARQNEARFQINKARRSRIRTFLRRVEEAIASGDKAAAEVALKVAQPELMRGVTKGVFHKNTASRKVSRLSARVKALG